VKDESTTTREITMTPGEVEAILIAHFGLDPKRSDLSFVRDTNGYVEAIVLTCNTRSEA